MEKDQITLDEFGLIDRFFVQSFDFKNRWPFQGVGDDCAFLDVGDRRIAVSADMMSQSTHFLDEADPYTVGRKALAVNLSDLAAAGATPKAFFLSISLPKIDQQWLSEFSRGLNEESLRYNCPLCGGDTTKAPLVRGQSKYTIAITVMGELPLGQGLTRRGALPGDDIWVTGTPGDAYAALGDIWGQIKIHPDDRLYFQSRMNLPTPRIKFGEAIRDIAHASADISDGLCGDLNHILQSSKVTAKVYWDWLPKSEAMCRLTKEEQQRCILSGGDDYELIFVAPKMYRERIQKLNDILGSQVTRIGFVVEGTGSVQIIDSNGSEISVLPSFNHFG